MNGSAAPSPALLKNKTFLIIAGAGIAILYIALNIGIWMYARNSKAAQTVAGKNSVVSQKQPAGIPPAGNPALVPTSGPSPTPTLTPTPTPRPTGPGPYACSAIAMCKLFDDAVRKANCTTTYADPLCLDQCQDKTKHCKI